MRPYWCSPNSACRAATSSPESLLLVGHYVGEQQRVEEPVAFGQMLADTDAARLFAANEYLAREHQVDHVFEADAVLVQRAAVLGGDAVDHLGGIECAGYVAGPALALDEPLGEDGEDLVGVDYVAVLIHRADAVRVAVGDEARVALLGDNGFLGSLDVGQDGLWVDAREERVEFAANLDKWDLRGG